MVETTELQNAWGAKLREARLAAAMTQADLAETVFGDSDRASSISRYETGKSSPRPETVNRLEMALGVRFQVDARVREDVAIHQWRAANKGFQAAMSRSSTHPISTSRLLTLNATQVAEAVSVILQETGMNRLPEDLDALHRIPITMVNIAKSVSKADFDALAGYIAQLEKENRELNDALKALAKPKNRKDLFLDEATKTLASWQAWAGIAAAMFAVSGYLELTAPTELLDCLEQQAPKPELEEWGTAEV